LKQRLNIIGYILLAVAVVCWIITPIIPFLNWDTTTKGIALTSVIVAGEAAFVAAIALLGKSFWQKIKALVINILHKKNE
jgi:predicted PurR-regulated permease PerM